MTVVPELEDIYNRYKKNNQSREYGRFIHFSNWIRRFPDYQRNLPLYDEWKKNTKLKNIDIHKVIEYFSNLGLPKQPDCSKRFGECQRLWIAAFWPTYGPILESCRHYVVNGVENSSTLYVQISDKLQMYLESQYRAFIAPEHIIDTNRESAKAKIKSSQIDKVSYQNGSSKKRHQRARLPQVPIIPQMISQALQMNEQMKNAQRTISKTIQRAPSEPTVQTQFNPLFAAQRYQTERGPVISSTYAQIVAGPTFWI